MVLIVTVAMLVESGKSMERWLKGGNEFIKKPGKAGR
jgi:hypothetical protein